MTEYSFKQRVRIADLDLSLQARAEMDAAAIEEYAEAMRNGAQFPPISVRDIGTEAQPHKIVTDGMHRVKAAMLNGEEEITAQLLPGTMQSAYLDALKANATHGLRRTNADKRHALEMAWAHRGEIWQRADGADPSAEVLARACGLSLRMVKEFLSGIQPVQNAPVERLVPCMPRRVFGADGKVRAVPPKMPTRHARATAGFNANANAQGHVVPVDRYGTEIPNAIGAVFTAEAEKELREMLRKISEVRVAVKHGRDCSPVYSAMRQEVEIALDNAYRFMSAAEPHCVCRICQGQGCKACHGRGWQTEEEYNRNPKEFKA